MKQARFGTFGPPRRLFRHPVFVQRMLEATALVAGAMLLPLLGGLPAWQRAELLVGVGLFIVPLFLPAMQRQPWLLAGLLTAGTALTGLAVPAQSPYNLPLHLLLLATLARNAPYFSWSAVVSLAVVLEVLYLGNKLDWSGAHVTTLFALTFTFAFDTAGKIALVILCKSWHDLHAAVQKSALELSAITGSSGDLIALVDRHGTIRSVNAASRTLLGVEPEALTGTRYAQSLFPAGGPALDQLNRLISADQPVYHVLQRMNRHDGSAIWLEWNLEPVPELEAVLCVGRDVTVRQPPEPM